jgi:hypothetical protein
MVAASPGTHLAIAAGKRTRPPASGQAPPPLNQTEATADGLIRRRSAGSGTVIWPGWLFLTMGWCTAGAWCPADIITATTVEGYRFENGNIFDLLDDNCIEWKIFEGDAFPVSFALSGMNLNALQGRFTDFGDFQSELSKPDFSPQFVFIEPKYGAHGFDVTGPGDFTCGMSAADRFFYSGASWATNATPASAATCPAGIASVHPRSAGGTARTGVRRAG